MTMESMESYVPPGFRFHPTDEELVGYYLRKKVASQKIDLDVIRDIDLYRIEPWDLKERCRIGYEEQNQWYFFSHKDKKYPTGTRTNRATVAGFWKATGRDKAVSDKSKLIGMRKTLVFYKGRAPNGQKTDWIMHEYRLESDEHGLPQEEGWVVCRAFKKRSTGHTTNRRSVSEGWDSSYLYDEPGAGVSSVVDPVEYMARQGLMCKQEIAQEAADNLNLTTFMQAATDQYLQQLPQLASPSLPLLKRPSSVSLLSDNHSAAEEERNRNRVELSNDNNSNYNTNKRVMTTDWRAFDKFVASQLSQEDRCEADSSFGVHSESSDMALLLLEKW